MSDLLRLEGVGKTYDSFTLADVSLAVAPREVVALVGESGSGKSTLVRLACGLEGCTAGRVQHPPRGEMQVVLQDAGHTLSPRWTVERTLSEPWVVRGERPTLSMLRGLVEQVQLPESVLAKRPHELSGGQKQRVAVARALATSPKLLILDEPLAGLDVSVAAQLIGLLEALKTSLALAMLFVTHDLWAARRLADRIGVMADGALVEMATAEALFETPSTEATKKLLAALPKLPGRPGDAPGADSR
ncbi:MAG: ATP-binding cassette domain-containing protein [Deltaproteobacteria bacterium]